MSSLAPEVAEVSYVAEVSLLNPGLAKVSLLSPGVAEVRLLALGIA